MIATNWTLSWPRWQLMRQLDNPATPDQLAPARKDRVVRPATGTTRPQPTNAPGDVIDRARRYLAAIPPAVAGRHGDADTFRVCCRLVRGFALGDEDAMLVLNEWNVKCEPPWSEDELRAKLIGARRYGREPSAAFLRVGLDAEGGKTVVQGPGREVRPRKPTDRFDSRRGHQPDRSSITPIS